jgi:hypothetical protein
MNEQKIMDETLAVELTVLIGGKEIEIKHKLA